MAAQSVSPRELTALHSRIGADVAELRRRLRAAPALTVRPVAGAPPLRAAAAVLDLLRAVRGAPGIAARLGVAALVVAGVAALLVQARREAAAGGSTAGRGEDAGSRRDASPGPDV